MSITRSQVVCGHRYLTDAADAFSKIVWELHAARPAAILERLDLRRPIYQQTAAYGHFGRDDPDFTWEVPKELVL